MSNVRMGGWDELGIDIDERSYQAPRGDEEAEDDKWIAWAVEGALRARRAGLGCVAQDRERIANDLLARVVSRYAILPYGQPYAEA